MNLHDIVNPLISSIVKNETIKICIPTTSQDANNDIITIYAETTIKCQIQLTNKQHLQHKDYYQHNQIYKRFYMSNGQLTGLNRNLGTNGDYIIWNNLYYKIVEVVYNFQTNWVHVVGCETTDFISG